MFLASLDCRLLCISLIVLSPVSKRLALVVSKSLCRVLRATTIAIVSHRSRFGVIAIRRRLQRYRTSAKICITGLSYPFGLLILEELLQYGVYNSLGDFSADALEFVPHVLRVFEVHYIEGDLIVDSLDDDAASYTDGHAVLLDFFTP